MNAIKRNIPNAITALNLFLGCIAIVFIFQNRLAEASWMVIFAAVTDFFDGLVARLLHVSSPIGKELDSLCDVVSFGVAPGMMIYQLINDAPYSWIGLLVPIFGAIRLARFNIDTRQTTYFIGLPIPANALLIVSFPLIIENNNAFGSLYYSNIHFVCWFFSILAIVCSALMVSTIKLFSMKVKNMSWAANKVRYILLILSLVAIISLGYAGVPVIIALYILLSLFANPDKEAHE